MLCSICGQIPMEPVVSIKSGHVFEKRLILEYLTQNQSRCPITNEELHAESDLLEIKTIPSVQKTTKTNNTTTFTPEAASIPRLLSLFQNEWDATILETFTLKKHLDKTRMELSHALYQHDAACRVIARLNNENTSLRAKLASISSTSASNGDVEMDTGSTTGLLSIEAIATIEAKQKALAKERKEFKKTIGPQRAIPLNTLNEWKVSSTHTLHAVDKSGILCMTMDKKNHIITGGNDKQIQVFNTTTKQVMTTIAGHGKKVTSITIHPMIDMIISGSQDQTIKLWTLDSSSSSNPDQDPKYHALHTLSTHKDTISSVSMHPTGEYLLSSSLDGTWAFSDLRSSTVIAQYDAQGIQVQHSTSGSINTTINCARFHPDGGIFGTGLNTNIVQMWDIKTMSNVVTFEGHSSPVNALTFSENGYQLATGSLNGMVHIWDLRKLKSIYEINLSKQLRGSISCLEMDGSGQYIAVGGGTNSFGSVCVLKEIGKTTWDVMKRWEEHKSTVTGVSFASDNSFIASTSLDRSLKLYSQ